MASSRQRLHDCRAAAKARQVQVRRVREESDTRHGEAVSRWAAVFDDVYAPDWLEAVQAADAKADDIELPRTR